MRTLQLILIISLIFSFGDSFSQDVDKQFVDEVDILENKHDLGIIEDPIETVTPEDYLQLSAYNMNIVHDTLFFALLDNDMEFLPEMSFRTSEGFDTIPTPGNLYKRGYQDGRLYYKNKGTFWGAFGIGFVTPYTYFFPGLALGGTMAAIGPNERNLRYHDTRMLYSPSGVSHEETNDLFNDINYSRGYKKGAHNRKLGNVAGGFGAGLGSGILVGVIIVLSFLSATN